MPHTLATKRFSIKIRRPDLEDQLYEDRSGIRAWLNSHVKRHASRLRKLGRDVEIVPANSEDVANWQREITSNYRIDH